MNVPAKNSPTGKETSDPEACKNLLESEGVSTHYLVPKKEIFIDESGQEKIVVYQMTQDHRRAWHAGKSRLPNLKEGETVIGLNNTSIGIELTHEHDGSFTDEQYEAVVGLVVQLIGKGYPIENILGHNEVAGDDVRGKDEGKTDPEGFDWDRFMGMLAIAQGVTPSKVSHYRSRVA